MLKLPFSSNMIHFPAILKPIHNNLSIKNGWSFPYLFKHKRWLCKEEEGKKGTLSPRWKLSPTLTTAPHHPYHLNSEKQQKPHQNHENEIFLWTSKSTHGGKMKNKNERGIRRVPYHWTSLKTRKEHHYKVHWVKEIQGLTLSNGGLSWRGKREWNERICVLVQNLQMVS